MQGADLNMSTTVTTISPSPCVKHHHITPVEMLYLPSLSIVQGDIPNLSALSGHKHFVDDTVHFCSWEKHYMVVGSVKYDEQ